MSLTITNTLSLRQFYKNNVSLVTSSNRKDATNGQLSFADSTALRTGIRRLQDYNWEDASESEVQQKLQAFVDTYNNTIESGTKYSGTDTAVKNAVSKIKSLTSDESDALEKLGITVEKTGYMTLSSTAATNITRSKYTSYFGEDNEYLENLYTTARHISRHVDIQL